MSQLLKTAFTLPSRSQRPQHLFLILYQSFRTGWEGVGQGTLVGFHTVQNDKGLASRDTILIDRDFALITYASTSPQLGKLLPWALCRDPNSEPSSLIKARTNQKEVTGVKPKVSEALKEQTVCEGPRPGPLLRQERTPHLHLAPAKPSIGTHSTV